MTDSAFDSDSADNNNKKSTMAMGNHMMDRNSTGSTLHRQTNNGDSGLIRKSSSASDIMKIGLERGRRSVTFKDVHDSDEGGSSLVRRHEHKTSGDVDSTQVVVVEGVGNSGPFVSFNDYTINEEDVFSNSIPRRHKTTGDIDSTQVLEHSKSAIRLSVAHPNDKNDSDSSLSFKEFRRSLSILKQSLHVCDVLNEEDENIFILLIQNITHM